jgi:hypothetical protein
MGCISDADNPLEAHVEAAHSGASYVAYVDEDVKYMLRK